MKLDFYTIDENYCKYLHNFDSKVPDNSGKKTSRPFVGIVLSVNSIDYYAPLSSPKKKHMSMDNQIDFLKIDGGRLGAINFNNMIPVIADVVQKVDIEISTKDNTETIKYKNLLYNQKCWCDDNKKSIFHYASRLHSLFISGTAPARIMARCCDFPLLEEKCREYKPELVKQPRRGGR